MTKDNKCPICSNVHEPIENVLNDAHHMMTFSNLLCDDGKVHTACIGCHCDEAELQALAKKKGVILQYA